MDCTQRQPKTSRSEEMLRYARNQEVMHMNVQLLGMEGDPDLQFLLQGGDLLKVRSPSWKKTRYYRLQEDCKTMWHESKKTFRTKQTFSLDDISAVRVGRQSEGLRKYTEEQVDGRCFSIIFKGRRKNLDLIASSEEEAKQWVNSLQKMVSNMNNLSSQQKTEHWIFSCLVKADKNKDDKLSHSEVKNFLRLINIEVDDNYAEMLFKDCDKSKSGYLSGKEIEHFYSLLTHREEIDVIFGEYAKTTNFMSPENLTSDYPVILSLENHCCVEQQAVMAHHMSSILGSALVTSPLGDGMPTNFPSPEELKGKILIKGKRLNKLEASFAAEEAAADDPDVTEEEESNDEDEQKEEEKSKKKKKLKLAKELSDMVIYCKSVHFHSFEDARENQSFYEMSSFKEGKAVNLAEESANAYIHHNVDKLSRIYPGGTRTDSSNYNPVPLWNAGCQIVALNFQTSCTDMDVNQGRFLINGKSGYILKPAYMRDRASEFDPITLTRGDWLKHKTLHVMVISAQQLPKVNQKKSSIVDPLVKVEIYGVPADVAVKETGHLENNGFNPQWNENFQFDVYVPELAMVRFVVEDYDSTSDNEFVAQYTLPFNSLKMGYRHVPLLNKNGDLLPSAGLFIHIMVTDAE
eukprot:superscaffoldBa00000448_g4815